MSLITDHYCDKCAHYHAATDCPKCKGSGAAPCSLPLSQRIFTAVFAVEQYEAEIDPENFEVINGVKRAARALRHAAHWQEKQENGGGLRPATTERSES